MIGVRRYQVQQKSSITWGRGGDIWIAHESFKHRYEAADLKRQLQKEDITKKYRIAKRYQKKQISEKTS